jgi:hypothetical protein
MTLPNWDKSDSDWFAATGHCGKCGQPGDYCLCTPRQPCGCSDRHAMGSGLVPDAIEKFAEVAPDQDGLF